MRMECLSTGEVYSYYKLNEEASSQTRCFSFVSTNGDQFKDKYRIAYSDK